MAEGKGTFASELTASFNQTLDWKKLLVAGVAIAVGVAIAQFLGWIGTKIAAQGSRWYFVNWIVRTVGIVVMIYAIVAAMVGVAAMTLAAAKGGKSGRLGLGFSTMLGKLFTVVMATLGFGVLYALALLPIWVIGWLGRIPGFGPVFWGAASFLAVLGALFGAFVVFRFFVTMYVLPAIVASGQRGRASFNEGKRVFFRQSLPLLKRWVVVIFIILVYHFVIFHGVGILKGHTQTTAYKNAATPYASPVPRVIPHLGAPFVRAVAVTNVMRVGGWLFGVEYAVISAVLLALPVVFFTVSGCHSYAALKGEPEEPIKVPEIDLSKIKGLYESQAEALRSRVREEMGEGGEEKKGGAKK